MSDQTLWVHEFHDHDCGMSGCAVGSERPASPADLVAAVRNLPGVTEAGTFHSLAPSVPVPGPGHYLVVPVEPM